MSRIEIGRVGFWWDWWFLRMEEYGGVKNR
jgi:hypothetical protein